jgi:DNA-directed RNA polymerase specialized sigma24 family protein
MFDPHAIALLEEALEFLNDRPSFGLRSSPDRTSHGLASRIRDHLKEARIPAKQHAAVAIAIDQWAECDNVEIDAAETEVSERGDGIWVRAWVLVGHDDMPPDAPPSAVDPAAWRQAYGRLPEPTRTIFYLHRVDGFDYPAIAARLSISVEDVTQRLAEAILTIDQTLERRHARSPT